MSESPLTVRPRRIDHTAAVAAYLDGSSVRAVARQHRVAYATAYKHLERANVIRRGATAPPAGLVPREAFLAMLATSTPAQVAKRIGITKQAVYSRCQRLRGR